MNMLLVALIALVARIGLPPQQPRAAIEGVVIKLGTGEPLADASVQLNLEDAQAEERPGRPLPRAGSHHTTKSDRNGRFIFENVAPGSYRLIATSEGGYVPADYGQRSATGQGINFEIAAGQVVTDRPESVADVSVVLVPDVRRRTELYRTTTTDVSGRFHLDRVPPGDYKVFAWEEVQDGAWYDPEFLRAHENRGMPIRIVEGRSENVRLEVIR